MRKTLLLIALCLFCGLAARAQSGPVPVVVNGPNGYTFSATFTYTLPPITSVSVLPANTTCGPPTTVQFAAQDQNGNDVSSRVTNWSSSDTTNASISSTGLVTCGSPANNVVVTISATAK